MRRKGKSSLKRTQRRLELRFAEAVEQVTKAPEWYEPPEKTDLNIGGRKAGHKGKTVFSGELRTIGKAKTKPETTSGGVKAQIRAWFRAKCLMHILNEDDTKEYEPSKMPKEREGEIGWIIYVNRAGQVQLYNESVMNRPGLRCVKEELPDIDWGLLPPIYTNVTSAEHLERDYYSSINTVIFEPSAAIECSPMWKIL